MISGYMPIKPFIITMHVCCQRNTGSLGKRSYAFFVFFSWLILINTARQLVTQLKALKMAGKTTGDLLTYFSVTNLVLVD